MPVVTKAGQKDAEQCDAADDSAQDGSDVLIVAVDQVVDQRIFGAVRIASVFREDFVRSVGRTVGRAVEVRVVVVRMADVDAVVAAAQAVVDGRTVTSAALAGAPRTLVPLLVGVVILRALVLALLASFVLDTLLADLQAPRGERNKKTWSGAIHFHHGTPSVTRAVSRRTAVVSRQIGSTGCTAPRAISSVDKKAKPKRQRCQTI